MTHKWLSWLPAVVVPAMIGVGVLVVPMMATASADLPAQTPQQVVELVEASSVTAFSGTVQQSSDLGLPDLTIGAATAGPDAASMLDLLSGSHTAKVYVDGPTKARLQVLDSLAERDLIRNGSDLWYYDSAAQTATHVTLPAHSPDSTAPDAAQTPAQVAARFLAAVDPSTQVSVGPNTTVAGRPAYDLVLTPRSTITLVGSVSIAVDSATGLPLSVDVHAKGQNDPAFSVAFTQLSLETPAADVFTFTPPAGTTVKQQSLPTAGSTAPPETMKPTVTGTGWDAVASFPAGSAPASVTGSPFYDELTQPVAGGRAFSTPIVNILITPDGRVYAGAVPIATLQSAAAAG